jgi:hypothetical protein
MSKPKPVDVDPFIRRDNEEDGAESVGDDPRETFLPVEDMEPNSTLSGGDVDAARTGTDAGEETVGGSAPTPDQDVVEELGAAAGVTYKDNEPLWFGDKVADRDAHRWELNPASSEEYQDRLRDLSGVGERAARKPAPTKRLPRAGAAGRGKQTASRAKKGTKIKH